jgi:hypothetical protein
MPLQAIQSVKVKTGAHAGRAGHVTNGDDDAAIAVELDQDANNAAEAATFAIDELEVL